MQTIAFTALLWFVFTIPWAYSADFGAPFGNVARLAGIGVVLVAVPAVLQKGAMRRPGAAQWMGTLLLLWWLCSTFWAADLSESLTAVRGFAQVMLPLWLVWELTETPKDVQNLMRAYVLGAWVLAALTFLDFASSHAAEQARFAAQAEDPNDVARFLDYAMPIAGVLFDRETRWWAKAVMLAFLPAGFAAVLLTASREGFLAAILGLGGCVALLALKDKRTWIAGALAIPAAALAFRFLIPPVALTRIATIPEQLLRGDWNARMGIWAAGWEAFSRNPFLGQGAGSFVHATRLAEGDTAHNTLLAFAVEGGMVAVALVLLLAVAAAKCALHSIGGPLRIGLATALGVCVLSSLVATVQGNRATWFLLALMSVASRLTRAEPDAMRLVFRSPPVRPAQGGKALSSLWPAIR